MQDNHRSIFAANLFLGQTIVVTGAGSGIGRAVALELASLGAHVALLGRTEAKLEAVRLELASRGLDASAWRCDTRDAERVEVVIGELIQARGGIDGLVNNAGGQYISRLEDISPNGFRAVVDNNLAGTFLMMRQCFLRSMQQRGGAIVNVIADIWGSMPLMAHSGAARAGMLSLTETAAAEWGSRGVRVNAVAPGYIDSSGMDQYPEAARPMLAGLPDTVPLGRMGTEAEIAAAIVFLLCPASAFTSGALLRIDGARPQARPGWQVPNEDSQRAAVRAFAPRSKMLAGQG